MRRILLLISFVSCVVILPAQVDSVSEGTASFYAQKFQGRKTSSGEVFQHDKFTAAHKSLPFGTYLRITNLSNDSVVVVKVNDRLPKKSKRSVDLTLAAAKQLNFVKKGLTRVRIEVIEKPEEEASE